MKNLLSIGFVFVLLIQPLIGRETGLSEGQKSTRFSAVEFKEKPLLMCGDICDIQVVQRARLREEYGISWDNNCYIEFSGDDAFLKGIEIVIGNDGIKIKEDWLSFNNGIRELELKIRRYNLVWNDWEFDDDYFFIEDKDGEREYIELPKVTIYFPEKCLRDQEIARTSN